MKTEIKISACLAEEFVQWAKDKSFCNSGQHVCDRLADFFENALKEPERNLNEKLS